MPARRVLFKFHNYNRIIIKQVLLSEYTLANYTTVKQREPLSRTDETSTQDIRKILRTGTRWEAMRGRVSFNEENGVTLRLFFSIRARR